MEVFVFDKESARDSFMIRCNAQEATVINDALQIVKDNDDVSQQVATQMQEAVNPTL